MVNAQHGVLLTCDVPLKEILKALNATQDAGGQFIIHDLKDGNLFIRADKLQWVQKMVKSHIDRLHYIADQKQQKQDHT